MSRLYASGLSRPSNARPFMLAGAPIGVVAGELSRRGREEVARYTSRGGLVFVDSGAFTVASRGGSVDFVSILATYLELARASREPWNLAVVAPDVVGDQAATLELLAHHQGELAELVELGVELLVPYQKGELTCRRLADAVALALDDLEHTVAVPFNLHAWSVEDVARFALEVEPACVHLLGGGTQRLDELENILWDRATMLQGDANRLRSYVGSGRLADRARRTSTATPLDDDWELWADDGEEWLELLRSVTAEALWEIAWDELGNPAIAWPLPPNLLGRFQPDSREELEVLVALADAYPRGATGVGTVAEWIESELAARAAEVAA